MDDRVKRVFDGLSLVAVGLVFLGNTLGVFEWSVWLNILSLWPLLIVVAGIDLVGKSLDSGWVRAISSLVFIGGLAYAVFIMPAGGWPGTFGFGFGRETVPYEGSEGSAAGLERASARIDAAVGELRIAGGADDLVEWEGRSSAGEPIVEVSEEASSADVRVRAGRSPGMWVGTQNADLDLRLNDSVPWSLRMDSGAGEFDADLSDLEVSRVEFDSGVGAVKLRLGNPLEGSRVNFDSGIASIEIRLPEDAEARVRIRSGLGSRNLPDGFQETGDGVYETGGFEADGSGWDIVVESGIGSLDIKTY